MGDYFTTFDLFIFFAFLVAAMVTGLVAGRKEETSEDYFLAGRKIPWWGVAGSIFGSNVSANHIVGMLGIGFSIGFAQSHFELGAIAGLMMLCYGFLPVYRKLRIYTLSEYLARRYDERSRVSYAIIMVIIMAVVQMVPGLYIGARSMCLLMGGDAVEEVTAVNERLVNAAEDVPVDEAPTMRKRQVNFSYYAIFVVALSVVAAGYTIFGGLKAVVWTDVIQSVLMLAAAILVAVLTFYQLGGWQTMMQTDRAGEDMMHLYLPTHHPQLPWTGVFTGLMFMHCFYWGTNQFIVQRALGASSGRAARTGIIFAGFLKLLIPFFAIATGVAALYLFSDKMSIDPSSVKRQIDPDAAFTELVKIVIPAGIGIVGVIAAGLIGAILSSIDSMMNSAATIVTIDIYQRYINPKASERQLIFIGRVSIVVFVVMAALMAIFILDPNSGSNFFLEIVNYQNYLTPGILVTFLMGMFWRRGTAHAAFYTIIAGVVFSAIVVNVYDKGLGSPLTNYGLVTGDAELEDVSQDALPGFMKKMNAEDRRLFITAERMRVVAPIPVFGSRLNVIRVFGPKLNFFHRVVAVILLCVVVYVLVSWMSPYDEEKGRLVWTDLGGHAPGTLGKLTAAILFSIGLYGVLGSLMNDGAISPPLAAVIGALWTLAVFAGSIVLTRAKPKDDDESNARESSVWADDRVWAGILCSLAVFMLFYFY